MGKLKSWQGRVSCVTLLECREVERYRETWNRIVEMTRALREQAMMLRYDYVPIYRAVSLVPRAVPVYDRPKVTKSEVKVSEEKKSDVTKVEAVVVEKVKVKSKLKATTPAFNPGGIGLAQYSW